MSDLIVCEKEKLIEIADAIRAKTGSSEPIGFPSEFAPAIEGITVGGGGGSGGPLQAKTAWPSHDEQVIAPDEDYYGLVSVKVMPVPRLPAAVASVESQSPNVVDHVVNIAVEVSVTAEDYSA